jgi:hypothetical protein
MSGRYSPAPTFTDTIMLLIRERLHLCAAPLLLVFLTSCGSKVMKVTGTLTYKGQPVTNAIVNFVPETGRPSVGETDDHGRFKLAYTDKEDGAEFGKHKVSVLPKMAKTAQQEPGMAPKQPRDMAAFFDKYSYVNSKIEVTIDKNTKDLQLNWD